MTASMTRPTRRSRWLTVGVPALLVVLLVVGITSIPGIRRGLVDPSGRAPVSGVTEVEVRDDWLEYFAFTPSVIEVPLGTTVTWTSTSRTEHNVVFGPNRFSPMFDAGGSWSTTFDEVGDHAYTCTLHEGMDGRVVVVG